jgi:hypothetical protein
MTQCHSVPEWGFRGGVSGFVRLRLVTQRLNDPLAVCGIRDDRVMDMRIGNQVARGVIYGMRVDRRFIGQTVRCSRPGGQCAGAGGQQQIAGQHQRPETA